MNQRYSSALRGLLPVMAAGLVLGVMTVEARDSAPTSAQGGVRAINVLSATYGANCGARDGNATRDFAAHCTGREDCRYAVDRKVLGDPARGCKKDFVADWSCGANEPHTATLAPEASAGSVLMLTCVESTGAGK
jgi:hypothetical protein